jgi:transposase-like protein
MSQKRTSKEEIVAEYLTGNYTYRELGLKLDGSFKTCTLKNYRMHGAHKNPH